MSNIITVDLDEVKTLEMKGDRALVTPAAESVLIRLLEIEQAVADAKAVVEKSLEKKALELNPNFKGFTADKIRIKYQPYGAKYRVDESRLNELDATFYTKEVKTSIKINTKAIEKYAEEKGAFPVGIIVKEREKQLSFKLKDGKDEKNDD
jgi:hypothetical protein